MVGIGLVPSLFHGLRDTAHLCLRSPEKIRQLAIMAQAIARGIVRPFKEIDAPHIFAPADDLANESFGRVDGHVTCFPSVLNSSTHLHRIEQADVQIGRHQRVIEKLMLRQHRILIIAKFGQPVFHKMRQGAPRLPLIGGKPERARRPEMITKPALHQRDNVLNHFIRRELHRPAEIHLTRGRLAVVMVIIPLAARWIIAFHQQPRLAAHFAVKILHP
mmetsp:Transcript_78/g.187  ORF Transcript_78/g.187 Transcript_78/m.187 type:complete len:218 (+) Transcript_78:367-1020(+)